MSNSSEKPRQSTRAQRRAEKTLRLLQLAMEMIVEGGLDGLTMPGLAERAGVAVGGIYRYFSGKEALIAGLQLHALHQLDEFITTHGGGDGAQGAESMVLAVADFARVHPTSYLLLEIGVSDPRLVLGDEQAAVVQKAVEPVLAKVADLLDEGVHLGELRPGDSIQRTHALWGLVVGTLHARKQDARVKNTDWHAREVLGCGVRAMIRGWRV